MDGPIRDFRDLIIWRKSLAFAKEIYNLTRLLPRDEQFGLVSQLRRAAISVSSNIAEGHARQGREFRRFLSIARGSLAEAVSQLLLAVELGFLTPESIMAAEQSASEIRRMAAALSRNLPSDP